MSTIEDSVRAALHQNLIDTTGECTCYEGYTKRGLTDPECGWHLAEPTAADESVRRVVAAVQGPRPVTEPMVDAALDMYRAITNHPTQSAMRAALEAAERARR